MLEAVRKLTLTFIFLLSDVILKEEEMEEVMEIFFKYFRKTQNSLNFNKAHKANDASS